MRTHGKKFNAASAKIDRSKEYNLSEAIVLVKESKFTKFDETVDIMLRMGIDPKKSDQQIRGAVVMPNGLGKKVRILAFAKGDAERAAKEAGAEYVGGEDLAQKVNEGWSDFDSVVATPDMMAVVGRVGKVLGPRGLMPNPKTGTVTPDISKAIKELKAGKSQFRLDKAAIVHAPVGKVSFAKEKLEENIRTFIDAVIRARPATAKGKYVKKIVLSSTMGPGLRISCSDVGA